MSEVTYDALKKRIAELEDALAKAADDLHYGAQKARTPSFATVLFDAEKNARATLTRGKDE